MIKLECRDGSHFKFWNAQVKGATLEVHFGRIGTDGQIKARKLASPSAAQAELDKLVREKLGKGYVRKGGASKATKPTKAPKPHGSTASFSALIRILAPDAKDAAAIEADVIAALDTPKEFLRTRGKDLAEERSCEADDDSLAWVTMVDRLHARGWIGEAEHDEGGEELRACIDRALKKRIAPDKRRWAWVDDQHWETECDAGDRLKECGKEFRKRGVVLVSIDISSDCWPIAAIPKKLVAEALRLAKKIDMEEILVLEELEDDDSDDDDDEGASDSGAAAADPKNVARAGMTLPEIVGRSATADIWVISSTISEKSSWVDLRSWPPKVMPQQKVWARSAEQARDGRWVVLSGFPKKERYIRIYPRTMGAKPLHELPHCGLLVNKLPVEFAAVGWIGDRVIALPGRTGRSGRFSVLPNAPIPYIQDGDVLVPAPGFRPGQPWAENSKVIACKDGSELVVWQGHIFEWKKDTFVRALPFDVPAKGGGNAPTFIATESGFFTVGPGGLIEIRRGAKAPIVHAKEIDDVNTIAEGPDGSIVLCRYMMATPRVVLYWPKTKKTEPLAKGVFGKNANLMNVSFSAKLRKYLTLSWESSDAGIIERGR